MTTLTREAPRRETHDLPIGGLPRGVELPTDPPTDSFLWHFSEEPDIARFTPRPVKANPDSEPLVWAIDDAHAPIYFFPRDCPRIAFWRLPTSTAEDVERLLGVTAAKMVIAVESAWLDRIRSCELYAYRLPAGDFVILSDYGAHVTRSAVTPLGVEPVGDLIDRLVAHGVELRITPSLWPLRRALVTASLHFSMIRMRNAAPEKETA